MVWEVASQRQFYADTAKQQSQRAAANANAEFQDCLAHSARVDMLQCIEGVAEAKRAAQRAEYDLAAQQEMAYWTPWMLLSSVLAATAAVIGVVYIAGTLQETRRGAQAAVDAVDVTRDIGQRQIRAYVKIENMRVENFVKGQYVSFKYDVSNKGQTPAHIVKISIARLTGIDPDREKVRNIFPREGRSVGTIGSATKLHQEFGNDILYDDAAFDDIIAGKKYVLLCGCIIYKDIFGKTRRTVMRSRLNLNRLKNGTAPFSICGRNNRMS